MLRRAKNFLSMQKRAYEIRAHPELQKLTQRNAAFTPLSDSDHIQLILQWYAWAQAQAKDGGIPSRVDLQKYARTGTVVIEPSYPETTGYILCSLVMGHHHGLPTLPRENLDRLVAFLMAVQREDGSIPAASDHSRGLAFDTGQVLTGLVAYYRHIEPRADIAASIAKAADWLAQQIGADGQYSDASCYHGARAYYLQATIGLMDAAQTSQRDDWRAAAARNARWVYELRDGDAWLRRFSFEDSGFQNLHGIAYTLRGLIDLGRHLDQPEYVALARRCIDQMMDRAFDGMPVENAIPGYFADGFARYRSVVSPTGMCQTALCAFLLGKLGEGERYTAFGNQLIDAVKSFHLRDYPDAGLNGLLPGSWPVTGAYMHGSLPNWPIKFFLDGLYIRQGADPLSLEG